MTCLPDCDDRGHRLACALDPDTVRPMPLDDSTARLLSNAARKATEWTERRNELIRQAVASGHGVREVARAVGLNHATVLNIVKPRQR